MVAEPLSVLRERLRDIATEMAGVTSLVDYARLWDQFDTAAQQLLDALAEESGVPPIMPPDPEPETRVVIGHCIDALPDAEHELPPAGIRILRAMGPSIARLNVHAEIIPQPDGTYDFSRVKRDVALLHENGWEINLNSMWLSRLWTGGVPINEPYEAVDWRHGWRDFTPAERPWLFPPNHPAIDSNAIEKYATALAREVGDKVRYVSFWNEPDIGWFYPQGNAAGSYLDAARSPLYLWMWIPFMRGWRNVRPETLIVGPDSASPGNLELFLQLQRQYFTLGGLSMLRYDILAFHVYGPVKPPTIESSLNEVNRVGGFMEVIRRYYAEADIPPLWATELAADLDSPTAAWCKALLDLTPPIVPFPYRASRYFVGGDAAWDAGKFVPDAEYYAMREVARMSGKRRAARS